MKFTVTLDSLGDASEASALLDAVLGLHIDLTHAAVDTRRRGLPLDANASFEARVRHLYGKLAPIFRRREEGAASVTFDIDVTPEEREVLYAAIAARTVCVRTCFEEGHSRHGSFWEMRNKVLTCLEAK